MLNKATTGRPAELRLPDATSMGQVALDVGDLDLMTAFYRDVLLLDQVGQGTDFTELGRDGQTLVTLRHRPGLPRGERRSAGLYHTALLHPDAAGLATVVASVAINAPQLYTAGVAGYATGEPERVAQWLTAYSSAIVAGAAAARTVADSVLAGSLS